MADTTFESAARVVEQAIAGRVFPGAVVEIGRHDRILATITRGTHTYGADSPEVDDRTIYDLASLTKVLATTALALRQMDLGRMRLDDRVQRWIPSWQKEDRQSVTLTDLLEHSSGLPANSPLFQTRKGRAAFELAIGDEPLEYPPRTRSIYTDLGFMLLGFAIEHASRDTFDRAFDEWRDREVGANVELRFQPPGSWLDRTAPTEDSPGGDVLRGIVHDENAAALDGVAGHAGLFGTATAVGVCARWWLSRAFDPPSSASSFARFVRKSAVPGSSRALGWDTMLPTSSCGTRLSTRAFGHTGFTGTSLWIDPAQDLYVVFLSNRVHPTRQGDRIQQARRDLHDAIVSDLSG
jgi:CubicO group peptidase (beta-lactamase class C family)